MSLALVGVNHKGSPVAVRERLAALGAKAALEALIEGGWKEAVVLSTCNRFEIYAADRGGEPLKALGDFLDRFSGMSVSSHAYRLSDVEAVRQLFTVASGLDSLVLGEGEILGQVKQAYQLARQSGSTGRLINVLFQRSLHVGKAVRSGTGIGTGQVSVASVAAELARRIFGRLDKSALILGAGKMAEKTARHLQGDGLKELYISNRTWEKALALAEELDAEPVRWENFPALLSRADIVLTSTGSRDPVVTTDMVASALPLRRGRSLFFIDIAMPRDVAGEVNALEGVYLYHLEHLQSIVDENVSDRFAEIAAAREIVRKETETFGLWLDRLVRGEPVQLRHSTIVVPS